jgi:putative flavoprotein involved in K+ transport
LRPSHRPFILGVDAMGTLDAVVVGAGQAGLAVSYFLYQDHREHIVFERGKIGESWLSQRWDSFRLNTPNFMNTLPGLPYDGPEPDGFSATEELVHRFQQYASQFQLPVQTGVTVVSVRRTEDQEHFIVDTTANGRPQEPVISRSLVVASGVQQRPRMPEIASRLPRGLTQLHTVNYRSAGALPPGPVVIVGSGQSGCQIAEDLMAAGRTVYLCTSKVGRIPRRYRGRDILEWWIDMGFLDVTYDSLEDKSISRAAQPQISGLGRHGHTVSLQQLAHQGALILGRLLDIQADTLILGDDASAQVRFADEFSQQMKRRIDAYLAKAGIALPPVEEDPADAPDPQAECVSPLRRLDLLEAKISTVIWATGFIGDFDWIHLPILDTEGRPIHVRGVSPVRGLYFIGFPWLNSRKSGIIYGVGEDARYIANVIAAQLRVT